MNSCPWHSAAARGGLCLGLVESFRGCSGAPVGRQHRADGYSRAAGEISPNPALCRGGCQAPARGPQVLCTPRCPFNQVAADASTTPHHTRHPPHTWSSSPPTAPALCRPRTTRDREQDCGWLHPTELPAGFPSTRGCGSSEHQPRRCLGGSCRMQRRLGRNSSGSTNRL